MDFNYEIGCVCLSLEELCAIKVARKIVDESGIALELTTKNKILAAKAIQRVDNLNAPFPVKDLVETFIRPIVDELCYWHRNLCLRTSPVLTQQGTLDLKSSAKDLLDDEKEDRFMRFLLACAVCSEKHIYEIGRQLSHGERSRIKSMRAREVHDLNRYGSLMNWRPLARFWLNAYEDRVGERFDGQDLPKETYCNGIDHALKHGKDIPIRHFLKKGEIRDLNFIVVLKAVVPLPKTIHARCELDYSPATFCFMASMVEMTDNIVWNAHLSFYLLRCLINWPYQRFFLKASRLLIHQLRSCEFRKMLCFLVLKVNAGYKECNYRELFTEFWKLGAAHRKGTSIADTCGMRLAHLGLTCEDQLLAKFLMSQISAENKKMLLLELDTNAILIILICKNRFQQLEWFIRICGMGQKNLLLEFREKLVATNPKCPQKVNFLPSPIKLKVFALVAGLRRVVEITDKIISEDCTDESME